MEIPINAKVNCSDGPCGRSTRLIVKPSTEEITHLVVSNEQFRETEYLVPIDRVIESTPNLIRLDCSSKALAEMQVFDQVEFIPFDFVGIAGGRYLMWPYYAPSASFVTLQKEHVPEGEFVIRRGANVEAADGHIGQVDEFLINSSNDQITHLVMRRGHFWKQLEVTIPVSQIDHYDENGVYLKLHKQDIDQFPSVPVQHIWRKRN